MDLVHVFVNSAREFPTIGKVRRRGGYRSNNAKHFAMDGECHDMPAASVLAMKSELILGLTEEGGMRLRGAAKRGAA